MIVDIVMPKMGESITEGTILEWRKKVGDPVEKDELFLEIGTDKVDSEIPCVESGIIVEILAEVNEVVEVGKVIAKIETDQLSTNQSQPKDETAEPKTEPVLEKSEPPEIQSDLSETQLSNKIEKPSIKIKDSDKFFTRAVMKTARENNISQDELDGIQGTGRKGRVTKKDILQYIKSGKKLDSKDLVANKAQFASATHTQEMDHMRKIIADHMKTSLETSAHVHVVNEVNMTAIANYINEKNSSFEEQEGFSLTFTPFILDAVIKALKDYPEMNASINNTAITFHKNINIGVAVALNEGLMVPVMFNCEEKNFLGLCRALNDLSLIHI